MAKIGKFLTDPKSEADDYLSTVICHFKKYEGSTWRQVMDCDPNYVYFILFNTDLRLPEKLAEFLEAELDEMNKY